MRDDLGMLYKKPKVRMLLNAKWLIIFITFGGLMEVLYELCATLEKLNEKATKGKSSPAVVNNLKNPKFGVVLFGIH